MREASERKNLFRIGLALLVYLLVSSAVQATVLFLCGRFLPQAYSQDWLTLASSLLGYAVGLPIFYGFVASMPKKKPAKNKLSFTHWIAFLAIAFLLIRIGSYAAEIMMTAMELMSGKEISNAVSEQINQSSPLLNFIVMVVLAPIVEELICRKWIIDRLLPYSEVLALVTSGLLFGLIHGNFYQFFYATLLGLLFGAVYIKTGNIFHTMLMHAIINFTGSIIASFLNETLPEDFSAISSISPWIIVTIVYSLAATVLAICGVIYLVRAYKVVRFSTKGERELPILSQFKVAWLNPGTISLLVFCALLFLSSLFI